MRKLIISIVFVGFGFVLCDRLGGKLMWWVNQNTRDISGPKIRYLVNDVDADLVLMGTSRCNLHYVPSIIADTLKMSVYNGGIDASSNIYSHYIMLNHILAHHKPKMIGLEVRALDYTCQEDAFNAISFFAPYVNMNAYSDSVYRDAGTYNFYQVSHLYRYNAKAVSNIVGLIVNRQENEDSGYIPLPDPVHHPESLEKSTFEFSYDSLKVQYIEKFIRRCQEKEILLFFTMSPYYTVANPNEYSVLKQIAEENDIPVFDYHSSGLFHDHPDYFKDERHLWDRGARLYSMIFAHDLKEFLN